MISCIWLVTFKAWPDPGALVIVLLDLAIWHAKCVQTICNDKNEIIMPLLKDPIIGLILYVHIHNNEVICVEYHKGSREYNKLCHVGGH